MAETIKGIRIDISRDSYLDRLLRYGPDREVMKALNEVLSMNFPVYLHKRG